MLETFDVAILGGGPAALSELIRLQDSGLSVALVSDQLGGCMAMMGSQRLQSFLPELAIAGAPLDLASFVGGLHLNPTGDEYIKYVRDCFAHLQHTRLVDRVVSIDRTEAGFALELASAPDRTLIARNVIVATGLRPRTLHEELPPDVASTCFETYRALREGDLSRFADREVVVLGSGNTAFQLAAILTRSARSVVVLARQYVGLFPLESNDRFAIRAPSVTALELIAKCADDEVSPCGPVNCRNVRPANIYMHVYRHMHYDAARGELCAVLDADASAQVRASTQAALRRRALSESADAITFRRKLSDVALVAAVGVEANLPRFGETLGRVNLGRFVQHQGGWTGEPGLYVAGSAAGYRSVNAMEPINMRITAGVRRGMDKRGPEGSAHVAKDARSRRAPPAETTFDS